MDAALAQQNFEAENGVRPVEAIDELYRYDDAEHQAVVAARPWVADPHYFDKIYISAVALVKMTAHARSGGSIEIMGLMQGKIIDRAMIVLDAFALPVEGTETRVNAQAEGYEYMVDYVTRIRDVGRLENVIGWYHSHPGYGCWLSGIDVSTQMLNQQFQEPFVAVVIDPNRTVAAGKVEIGAFRTYPEKYKPPNEGPDEYQSIPLEKIEDFGVHCKRYYSLEIAYFKSSLDERLLEKMWTRYWVDTISQSPLFTNRAFSTRLVQDLSEKVTQTRIKLEASGRGSRGARGTAGFGFDDESAVAVLGDVEEAEFAAMEGRGGPIGSSQRQRAGQASQLAQKELSNIARDACAVSADAAHGMMSELLKNILFRGGCGGQGGCGGKH